MDYKEAFKALYEDARKKFDIQQAPKLSLRKDEENAQDDKHMRKMEMEAYLKGNLLLRDFEDNFKYQ